MRGSTGAISNSIHSASFELGQLIIPPNEVIMISELASTSWNGSNPCDVVNVHLLGEEGVK